MKINLAYSQILFASVHICLLRLIPALLSKTTYSLLFIMRYNLLWHYQLKKSEAENASNTKTILKLTNQLKEESKALREARTGQVSPYTTG